jgi:nucleoside phosphorylase
MEAYAVMLSGALSSIPKTIPVVIKCISDFVKGKSDTYQKYASFTSARVMMLLLDELCR